MTIEVRESDQVPDSTYFTTRDAQPIINDDGSVTIFNGEGSRRGWGRPGITSTVVYHDLNLLVIHVGYHHKHRGGQFWRYYDNGDGQARRIGWAKLPDETREIILQAYGDVAPRWAKTPGKLRKDYKPSNPKANMFTGYKIVAVDDDGNLRSLYDASTVYILGKTNVEKAVAYHGGGFYVYKDPSVKDDYIEGGVVGSARRQPKVALLECECWGNREYYDRQGAHCSGWQAEAYGHKIAVTYCKPIKVIEIFEVDD